VSYLQVPRRIVALILVTVLSASALSGIVGMKPARAGFLQGGTLSILASGLSQLGGGGLRGVCADPNGNIVFTNNVLGRIYELTKSSNYQNVVTIAGNGSAGNLVNGSATSSPMTAPRSLVCRPSGNILFTAGSQLARLTPSGSSFILTIIAGSGGSGSLVEGGAATAEPLGSPGGIAVSASGVFYVVDSTLNLVYSLTPVATSYVLNVIGGTGSAGTPTPGPSRSSALNSPSDIALLPSGVLVVTDTNNNDVELLALTNGSWKTSILTSLNSPRGVAVDTSGNLFVVTQLGNSVLEYPALTSSTISSVGYLIAGNGAIGYPQPGPSAFTSLNRPRFMSITSAGDMLIGDTGNSAIELVVAPTTTALGMPSVGVSAATESGSLTFNWSVSNDGGSAISYYSWSGACTGTGNVTSVTCTGLTGGQSYTLYVTATNAVGTSDWGAAMATAVTTPAAPQDVSISAGVASLNISWNAPNADGGSSVTSYIATATDDTGSTSTCVAGPGISSNWTACSISGLPNNTLYSVTVTATNSIGSSAPTQGVLATTPNTPDAPTGLQVTSGIGQITVSWTAPEIDGGVPVTEYLASTSDTNGNSFSCSTFVNISVVPTSCSISGLTNSTTYVIQVVAINAVGTSSSATSGSISTATVPDAPTPALLVAGNRSIAISWNAPANNGGAEVVGYVATATDVLGNSFTCTTSTDVDSNLTNCTITGLATGTTYAVTIQAMNVVGCSTSAESGNATTFSPPSAPVIVSAIGGPHQVVLTWSAPLQSGGLPVTSYTASDGQGHSCVSNTTTCTVTGLVNGHHYSFAVTATSAVGTSVARSFAVATPLGSNVTVRVAGFAQFSSTVTSAMRAQMARVAALIASTGRTSVTIRGYGNIGIRKPLQLARAVAAREALATALQAVGVSNVLITVKTGGATAEFGSGSPLANRCVVISTN